MENGRASRADRETDREAAPRSSRDPLDRLAEEFAHRHRLGERPSIEDYAVLHPELAAEIRALFPALVFMEDHGSVAQGSEGGATIAGTLAGRGVLGDYRIIRLVGTGGMGIVYEAEQLSLGRHVALKVLPNHARLDPDRLKRFQQEARAAARLQHTNIVPVHDIGEVEGIHFYTMQFVHGQGLNEILAELRLLDAGRGPAHPLADAGMAREGSSSSVKLPGQTSLGTPSGARAHYYRSVALIGVQVADALAYAHERGVLHRDIKPSNLLLDFKSNVWITDFGLAKAEGGEELTHTGDIVGTLRYMGPERFSGWSDPRSDVYGLGATLYELLTLRPPFTASDRATLLRQILHEAPIAPRRLDPQIPRDVETIVQKAMAREPAQRYQGAADIAADLRRFIDGRPIEARRSTTTKLLWLWGRRNPLSASLGAVAALLLVAVAALSLWTAHTVEEKRDEAVNSLREARLGQAHGLRSGGRPGRQHESLAALRQAAGIRPGIDLRNEALAAMALVDLKPLFSRRPEVDAETAQAAETAAGMQHMMPGATALALDPALERYAVGTAAGRVRIHRVADDAKLIEITVDPRPVRILHFFRPRGDHLAAVHGLRLRVIDLETGAVVQEIRDEHGHFAFGSDGRRFALGLSDGQVHLRQIGQEGDLGVLPAGHAPNQLAFRPGSDELAVCGWNERDVQLWDLASRAVVRRFSHPQGIGAIAWHPAGGRLAAACHDQRIHLWDARTGSCLAALEGHRGTPVHVAFDPAGDFLLSYGWDGRTILRHAAGQALFEMDGGGFQFSADGGRLAFNGLDLFSTFEVHEVLRSHVYRALHGHAGVHGVGHIGFSPDGRWLASSSQDDGLRIWEAPSGRELASIRLRGLESAIFRALGESLEVITSGREGLHLWPLTRRGVEPGARPLLGPPRRLLGPSDLKRARLSSDGSTVTLVDFPQARIVDVDHPERSFALPEHPNVVVADRSPDGRWIAGGTWHGKGIPIWEVESRKLSRVLPAEWSAVTAFSPDGRWLAVSTGQEVRSHSCADWEARWKRPRHRAGDGPGALGYSPDSRLLAALHSTSRVRLFHAEDGAEVATLEAPREAPLYGLAFGAGGTLLAGASGRGEVQLWDLHAARRGLAAMGLDWDLPPLPPKPGGDGEVAGFEVDPGDLAESPPASPSRAR